MATYLSFDDHVTALVTSGKVLRDAAGQAGLDAPVPTCPDWDVRKLVTHQGMVHRWAAANLRRDRSHRPSDSTAEAAAAPDLLGWFTAGLAASVDTLQAITASTTDTGHGWTVQVSEVSVTTVPGVTEDAAAGFAGTAAQLYLGLWNRGDEMTVRGRPDLLDLWRTRVCVRWG